MRLLDTSVAIEFQEDGVTRERVASLTDRPALSIFTVIELEGGVYVNRAHAEVRRRRLGLILDALTVLPFDPSVIPTYGRIVSALGFSRRQIIDRLIAATAIVHDLTLITTNERDFRFVTDLKLEVWPAQ